MSVAVVPADGSGNSVDKLPVSVMRGNSKIATRKPQAQSPARSTLQRCARFAINNLRNACCERLVQLIRFEPRSLAKPTLERTTFHAIWRWGVPVPRPEGQANLNAFRAQFIASQLATARPGFLRNCPHSPPARSAGITIVRRACVIIFRYPRLHPI